MKKKEQKIVDARARVDAFAKQKALEFARKIEGGQKMIVEDSWQFLNMTGERDFCGCAIGMAYVFKVGDAKEAYHRYIESEIEEGTFFSQELDIPKTVFGIISDAHQIHNFNAATIVEQLRNGRYDINFLSSR